MDLSKISTATTRPDNQTLIRSSRWGGGSDPSTRSTSIRLPMFVDRYLYTEMLYSL